MKKILLLVLISLLLVSCNKMTNENINFKEIVIDEKSENNTTIIEGKYCKIVLDKKNSQNENLNSNITSLNEKIEKDAKEFIDNSKTDYQSKTDEEKKEFLYTYSQEGELVTENENVLSFMTNTYVDTMGAHGTTIISSYNYDMNNGQIINLSNIVLDRNSLKKLIIEKFKTEEYNLYDDYESSLDNFLDFSNKDYILQFNLLDDGIEFIFNQYDIAPYAAGVITVDFTKEELNNIILNNYWE